MWLVAAAPLWLFAADHVLLDSLRADDHRVRARAAYMLARVYDPDDTTESAQVARLVRQGDDSEARLRPAAIHGLFAHAWAGGDPPVDVRAWMESLLDDPDPAIVRAALDGYATLEPRLALDPLRKRMRANVPASRDCARTLARLGDDEARTWMLSQPAWRGGMEPMRAQHCAIELDPCLDELGLRRWLGQTDVVEPIVADLRPNARTQPTFEQRQRLDFLDAMGGDDAAAGRLCDLAQQASDSATRLRLLQWALELPPFPRPELEAVLAHGTGDGAFGLRALAVPALSRLLRRFSHGAADAGYLANALDDRDPDVRLEVALALRELRVAPPAVSLANEDDPVVKDALRRATP